LNTCPGGAPQLVDVDAITLEQRLLEDDLSVRAIRWITRAWRLVNSYGTVK